MGDWRAAHRQELLEKQRHISQKLAQLRELRALIKKWRRIMRNYRDWFEGLEEGVERSKWFSVESLVRMGRITAQLNQLVREFEQVGDPKTTGTGTVSTGGAATGAGGTGSDQAQLTDQQRATTSAEWLLDRAGPLASMAPWELVWHVIPETSESVREGEYGPAIASILLNPFTSMAGHGFAEGIAEQSIALFENHPEQFEALEQEWKDTKKALDSISGTLDRIDLEQMRQLEEGLEGVLRDYESAYDGAKGADDISAHKLRQASSGRSTTR
jgi:hypothetical protein